MRKKYGLTTQLLHAYRLEIPGSVLSEMIKRMLSLQNQNPGKVLYHQCRYFRMNGGICQVSVRVRLMEDRNRPYIYAIVLAIVMTMFIAPEMIEGDSMSPAVKDGQMIIVTKQSYSAKRGKPDLGR